MKKLIFVILFLISFCIRTQGEIRSDNMENLWKYEREYSIHDLRDASFNEIPFDYDFEIDKLRYTILSKEDRTVTVRARYYSIVGKNFLGEVTDTTLIGSLEIPSHVTYNDTTYIVIGIGENAFSKNFQLDSIVIPNTITAIGDYAFYLNFATSYTFLGNNIQEIGEDAFMGMFDDGNLYRDCYIYSQEPPPGSIYLSGPATKCDAMLHVPVGCKEAYQQAEGWKQYGENIVDDIELSGIHNAQLKTQDSDAPVYDLQGRRVAHPKQGEIYIQNGKKYINK